MCPFMKKLLTVVALLAAMLLFAGCGGNSAANPSDSGIAAADSGNGTADTGSGEASVSSGASGSAMPGGVSDQRESAPAAPSQTQVASPSVTSPTASQTTDPAAPSEPSATEGDEEPSSSDSGAGAGEDAQSTEPGPYDSSTPTPSDTPTEDPADTQAGAPETESPETSPGTQSSESTSGSPSPGSPSPGSSPDSPSTDASPSIPSPSATVEPSAQPATPPDASPEQEAIVGLWKPAALDLVGASEQELMAAAMLGDSLCNFKADGSFQLILPKSFLEMIQDANDSDTIFNITNGSWRRSGADPDGTTVYSLSIPALEAFGYGSADLRIIDGFIVFGGFDGIKLARFE